MIPSRKNRAQTVLEFLMTYGWAILIIVIILAVLFYLGVLNPNRAFANTCLFPPGHSCYTFKIANGSGALFLDLGQASGKQTRINSVSCSANESAALQPLLNNVTIPAGEHKWTVGGSSGNPVNCTDAAGNSLSGTAAQIGERYKGRICIGYTETATGTNRVVCGDVVARLEPPGTLSGGDCAPTCAYGSACSANSQCATQYCNSTSGMCANCTDNSQCDTGYCSGGVCVSATPTPAPTPPACALGWVISACPCTLNTSGAYTLNSNLASSGTCITISTGASGSTLDCQGHSITGPIGGGLGIYLSNTSSVTVKNCVVSNFAFGIYVETYSYYYDRIINNTASSNWAGIRVVYSHYHIISGNVVNSNSLGGIELEQANYHNVTNNNGTANINGVRIFQYSHDNNFTGNNFTGNTNKDVQCDSSDSNIDGNNNICIVEDCTWLTCH